LWSASEGRLGSLSLRFLILWLLVIRLARLLSNQVTRIIQNHIEVPSRFRVQKLRLLSWAESRWNPALYLQPFILVSLQLRLLISRTVRQVAIGIACAHRLSHIRVRDLDWVYLKIVLASPLLHFVLGFASILRNLLFAPWVWVGLVLGLDDVGEVTRLFEHCLVFILLKLVVCCLLLDLTLGRLLACQLSLARLLGLTDLIHVVLECLIAVSRLLRLTFLLLNLLLLRCCREVIRVCAFSWLGCRNGFQRATAVIRRILILKLA